MKAIAQIIRYLRERGALSEEQIAHLEAQGFLRATAAQESDPNADLESDWEHPDWWDEHPRDYGLWDLEDEQRDQEARRRRTGRARGQPRQAITAAVLAERLRERSAAWEEPLEGLVRIGRRLSPCAGWAQAAVAVRQASPEELLHALSAGLQARDPSLSALWDTLAVEEYREPARDPGLEGPAVNAYRAVLAEPKLARGKKHGWLFHEDAIRDAFNLSVAQNRLFRAVEQLFSREPRRLAAAVQRADHPLAFWSLTLLYSARRGPPYGTGRVGERFPVRKLPDEALWRRAWSHAAVLDPLATAPFLAEYEERAARLQQAGEQGLSGALEALTIRQRDLLKYVCVDGLPLEEITRLHRWWPWDISRELPKIREALRQAFYAGAFSGSPAGPAALAAVERYIDDWLVLRERRRLRIHDYEFASEGLLFCPIEWD